MLFRALALLLSLLAGLVALPRLAAAEMRVALVIGNGAYRNVTPLANPASDARAMAETLAGRGFELIGGGALLDLDKAAFERAIREFGRRLGHDTVGLFYYAGHGIQVNGANYLVPVDAILAGAADVKYELVDAGFVLDEMTAASNRLNLVILDACRNNPFGGRGLRGLSRGLAQVTAPAGTLISYATQPGDVAADGVGTNSPYTQALVEEIKRPGQSVFDTFNSIGIAVKASTGGRQQPWLASSPIEGQFYFTPPGTAAQQVAQNVPPPQPAEPAGPAPEPLAQVRPPTALAAPPAAAPPAAVPGGVTLEICPTSFTSIPARYSSVTCGCPVSAIRDGSLVGDNPYAPGSAVCKAALHAGALTPAGGQVTAVAVPDVPFFPGVRRNNMDSSGSTNGGLGFRILVPARAEAAPRDPRLDATGRPVQQAIAPALNTVGVVQLYVNFATDRADPLPSSTPVLRELLAALRDNPGLGVELIGHTDSTGGAAHNQDLSERRAAAVSLWLAQNGIEERRLRSAGRGMSQPLADNASEAGRALNRRVEVKAVW